MKDLTRLHPIDYLKILYRRRWYAVAVFLLVGIGAVVCAWRKPDVYCSSRASRWKRLVPQIAAPLGPVDPEEQIAANRSAVRAGALERMTRFPLGYGMDDDFHGSGRAVSKNIEITTSEEHVQRGLSCQQPQLAQSYPAHGGA